MMWGLRRLDFFGHHQRYGNWRRHHFDSCAAFSDRGEPTAGTGRESDLFYPNGSVALITHRKNGTLDLKTAKPLALLGLAGAAAGAFLAVSLESEILKKLFGCFLLLMGLSEIFKKKKGEDTHAKG